MFTKNYSFIRRCAIIVALTVISTACTVHASEQQPVDFKEMKRALTHLIRTERGDLSNRERVDFYLDCLGVPYALTIKFSDISDYRSQIPARISMIRNYLSSLEGNPEALATDYGISYRPTDISDALERLDYIESTMTLPSSKRDIAAAVVARFTNGQTNTQSVSSKSAEPTTTPEKHRLEAERTEDARRMALEQERQRELAIEQERERARALEIERQKRLLAAAEAARLAEEQRLLAEAARVAAAEQELHIRRNTGATSMQRLHRGHQARRQAHILRQARLAQIEQQRLQENARQHAAAKTIQSTMRMKHAQKQYKKLQKAVTKLQARMRGTRDRARVTQIRKELAEREAAMIEVERAMAIMQAAAAARNEARAREAMLAEEEARMRVLREQAEREAAMASPIASTGATTAPSTFAGSSLPTLDMPGRSIMAAGGGYATVRGAAESEIVTTGKHDDAVRRTDEQRAARLAAAPAVTPAMQGIIDAVRTSGKGKIGQKTMVLDLSTKNNISPYQQAIIFQELGLVSS